METNAVKQVRQREVSSISSFLFVTGGRRKYTNVSAVNPSSPIHFVILWLKQERETERCKRKGREKEKEHRKIYSMRKEGKREQTDRKKIQRTKREEKKREREGHVDMKASNKEREGKDRRQRRRKWLDLNSQENDKHLSLREHVSHFTVSSLKTSLQTFLFLFPSCVSLGFPIPRTLSDPPTNPWGFLARPCRCMVPSSPTPWQVDLVEFFTPRYLPCLASLSLYCQPGRSWLVGHTIKRDTPPEV